jgi:hypothetical protein
VRFFGVFRGAYVRLKPVYIFRIPAILFAPERDDFFDHALWALFVVPPCPLSVGLVNDRGA